jgi:hypothetical protein
MQMAARVEVSSMGAWGATAGTAKLLLLPRQSQGISWLLGASEATPSRPHLWTPSSSRRPFVRPTNPCSA